MVLTGALPGAIAMAAKSGNGELSGALGQLESLGKSVLLLAGIALLAGGALLGACAWLIYAKKIRNASRPKDAWRAGLLGVAGLALITLLSGVLAIAMFTLTPFLIKELLGA